MAINDAYFNNNALQVARGAQRAGSDWVETNGGIVNPHRVHVPTGQYYYRFASSSTPHEYRMRGCWWIEYEVMTKIARFAREQESTPRDAARYFLALPWSWTKVDRLLRAKVVARLDAYRGEGKPAKGSHSRDAGTAFIPPQHIRELYQLYIPGLQNAGIAAEAFEDVSDEEIWSAPIFA